MAANTAFSASSAIISLPSRIAKSRYPSSCSLKPVLPSNPFPNPALPCFSFKISRCRNAVASSRAYKGLAVLAFAESGSGTGPELESSDSNKSAAFNLKLPRRSLLVEFTCNACGERTQRLINRLAYERGLVYVQCAGCLRHHKLVDNLGIIVEYDLRNDTDIDQGTDGA